MKLRTHKKSQAKKVILFLLLAITFSVLTGFLVNETVAKVNELSEVKNQVGELELTKADLEKRADELKEQEEELKDKLAKLEGQIEDLKKHYLDEDVNLEESNKVAYLTFDDGPSKNTPIILDFLKANNIKATFFVIGDPKQEETYKRIFDEGHTLAVHSYTHRYDQIYRNVDNFMADILELSDYLESITGVRPSILRFPGGSNTTIPRRYSRHDLMGEIIPKVEEEGFIYFDWNVDSRDAEKNSQDTATIVEAVLEGARNKSNAIILLHDAAVKSTTAEALPEIVEGLKKQGFIFREITPEVTPIKFR